MADRPPYDSRYSVRSPTFEPARPRESFYDGYEYDDDPRYAARTAEADDRFRRTAVDANPNRPVVVTASASGAARPRSPTRNDYRASDTFATSSSSTPTTRGHRPSYSSDMGRARDRPDAVIAPARGAAVSRNDAYRSTRPSVYYYDDSSSSRQPDGATEYNDEDWGYTDPGSMARYDLENTRTPRSDRRQTHYNRPSVVYQDRDQNRPALSVDTEPGRHYPPSNPGGRYEPPRGPPLATRGLDRLARHDGIPPVAPVPPSPAIVSTPTLMEDPSTPIHQRRGPPVSGGRPPRPVSLYQDSHPHDDYYSSRENDRNVRELRDREHESRRAHEGGYMSDDRAVRGVRSDRRERSRDRRGDDVPTGRELVRVPRDDDDFRDPQGRYDEEYGLRGKHDDDRKDKRKPPKDSDSRDGKGGRRDDDRDLRPNWRGDGREFRGGRMDDDRDFKPTRRDDDRDFKPVRRDDDRDFRSSRRDDDRDAKPIKRGDDRGDPRDMKLGRRDDDRDPRRYDSDRESKAVRRDDDRDRDAPRPRDPRDDRDPRDIRGYRDPRDLRGVRDDRDVRDLRDPRDPRDRDFRDDRTPRGSKDDLYRDDYKPRPKVDKEKDLDPRDDHDRGVKDKPKDKGKERDFDPRDDYERDGKDKSKDKGKDRDPRDDYERDGKDKGKDKGNDRDFDPRDDYDRKDKGKEKEKEKDGDKEKEKEKDKDKGKDKGKEKERDASRDRGDDKEKSKDKDDKGDKGDKGDKDKAKSKDKDDDKYDDKEEKGKHRFRDTMAAALGLGGAAVGVGEYFKDKKDKDGKDGKDKDDSKDKSDSKDKDDYKKDGKDKDDRKEAKSKDDRDDFFDRDSKGKGRDDKPSDKEDKLSKKRSSPDLRGSPEFGKDGRDARDARDSRESHWGRDRDEYDPKRRDRDHGFDSPRDRYGKDRFDDDHMRGRLDPRDRYAREAEYRDNGMAIPVPGGDSTDSSVREPTPDSDEPRQRIRPRVGAGRDRAFDPSNALDLRSLREEMADMDPGRPRDRPRMGSRKSSADLVLVSPGERAGGDSAVSLVPVAAVTTTTIVTTDDGRGREIVTTDSRARVVSPPPSSRGGQGASLDSRPIKGILKAPSTKFPEEPNPIREGVAPHKDDKKLKAAPPGARWTKISRKMVNPEALTLGKERFEERDDFVIVLRVLSKEEIQAYVNATKILRERKRTKEIEYHPDHEDDDKRKAGAAKRDDKEGGRDRERERDRDRDREREREKDRDGGHRRRRDDGGYDTDDYRPRRRDDDDDRGQYRSYRD